MPRFSRRGLLFLAARLKSEQGIADFRRDYIRLISQNTRKFPLFVLSCARRGYAMTGLSGCGEGILSASASFYGINRNRAGQGEQRQFPEKVKRQMQYVIKHFGSPI